MQEGPHISKLYEGGEEEAHGKEEGRGQVKRVRAQGLKAELHKLQILNKLGWELLFIRLGGLKQADLF